MRAKFTAIFAIIVIIVGGLTFALTRAIIGSQLPAPDAARPLAGATSYLQLQGLLLERWLAVQAVDPKAREPFNAGTADARAEAATAYANQLRDAASRSDVPAPVLVVLVDAQGVVLGRNGSKGMRGETLTKIYPALQTALSTGATGSDVWIRRERSEQLLTSYAPIRGADGAIVGALAAGTALNDERLSGTAERTSGQGLMLAVPAGDSLEVVARTTNMPGEATLTPAALEGAKQALAAGQVVSLGGFGADIAAKAGPLDGYGHGRQAVLIAVAAGSSANLLGSMTIPALGVLALGLVLVIIAGYVLDSYISRPVSEIEEGLLQVMNGRTDYRFELEHSELGGLAFRINSLLNQLLGVQEEEETDEQGRPSRAPAASSFQDALAVDERMATSTAEGSPDARALRDEPDAAYYARLYNEYVAGKKSLGDPTDHIEQKSFTTRIMANERELLQKHGKPVRFKIEVRGREVVLLAVPLA